jgi:endonuclease-3
MARESRAKLKSRAVRIVRALFDAHPDAHCALRHRNAYELLVATILSAQCTDKMVNSVMPTLLKHYPNAARLSAAEPGELESIIRSTGFYRSKARSLRAMAGAVVERHGGHVPKTMEELTGLPGVGRKTANVILGNAFGIPGIVVDTHVSRLARRMGLTAQEDPAKIERDLMELVPDKDWTQFSHAMIFHGRRVCDARNPKCEICPVRSDCPFPRKRRAARPSAGGAATRGRRA